MKKAYLLVHTNLEATRDEVKEWADKSPLVSIWRFDMLGCMYLISEQSAYELDADFEKKFANKGRYLITEIPSNCQGQLTADSWHLITKKTVKPPKPSK